jgi:hypothetical protein
MTEGGVVGEYAGGGSITAEERCGEGSFMGLHFMASLYVVHVTDWGQKRFIWSVKVWEVYITIVSHII